MNMKVATLHYSNSVIDLNRLFGMQVMEVNELDLLRREGVEAHLFTHTVNGHHEHILEVPYYQNDKSLLDIPYYTRFIDMNPKADVLQGNATPLLAAFQPERTVIRFDGFVELPLTNDDGVRTAYERANYIFVSEFLKNIFLTRYPFLPKDKCHVLHNAVNDASPVNRENRPKKKRLLFCSRWISDKGIDILHDVLADLEKRRDDYELFLAGGLHQARMAKRIGEKEEKIKAKFAERKNVQVVGYLQQNELLEMFGSVDLLLFPSVWDEPFGLVPAEAGIAGVPTVAFSVGGVPEVISHKETGLLVKKSRFRRLNVRRYAAAVERCLDDESILMEMGERARQRCTERFQWNTYIKKLLAIYAQVKG